jgi:hypothetical protein
MGFSDWSKIPNDEVKKMISSQQSLIEDQPLADNRNNYYLLLISNGTTCKN